MMYLDFEYASREIMNATFEVRSKLPPGLTKREFFSKLKDATRSDSASNITRIDFLTAERVRRLLNHEAGMAIQESVKILFPRTWSLIDSCAK